MVYKLATCSQQSQETSRSYQATIALLNHINHITLQVAYVLALKNLQAGYVMMLRVTYFPKQSDWCGNMPISIINSMVSSVIWD